MYETISEPCFAQKSVKIFSCDFPNDTIAPSAVEMAFFKAEKADVAALEIAVHASFTISLNHSHFLYAVTKIATSPVIAAIAIPTGPVKKVKALLSAVAAAPPVENAVTTVLTTPDTAANAEAICPTTITRPPPIATMPKIAATSTAPNVTNFCTAGLASLNLLTSIEINSAAC